MTNRRSDHVRSPVPHPTARRPPACPYRLSRDGCSGERRGDGQRDTRRRRWQGHDAAAWDVDGLAPPVSGRIPRSLVVVAPGFELDRRAVAKRCSPLQAKLNECPKKSKIGTGALGIVVHRPDRVNEITFDIVLYHGKNSKVLAVTDFIGIRVVPGRLIESGGVRLSFDPLPTPPDIPGHRDHLRVQGRVRSPGRQAEGREASRAAATAPDVPVQPRRTPTSCKAGSWAATAKLGFPDGTSAPLATPMACSAR